MRFKQQATEIRHLIADQEFGVARQRALTLRAEAETAGEPDSHHDTARLMEAERQGVIRLGNVIQAITEMNFKTAWHEALLATENFGGCVHTNCEPLPAPLAVVAA